MQQPTYQVHESFHSIQGEGIHAGRTALFLRLQGCPVGCDWCDAKLTWFAGGQKMNLREIRYQLDRLPQADLVVVTGGEPLIYDLDPLLLMLHQYYNEQITLETSGALPLKGGPLPPWLWVTVSPKYPRGFDVVPEVLGRASELKYVVDGHFSPEIAYRHLGEWAGIRLDPPPPVLLMPEGCPPRPENVRRVLDLLRVYPAWRFGPRLQYAHPEIAAQEGDTNDGSITRDQALSQARSRRGSSAPLRELPDGARPLPD